MQHESRTSMFKNRPSLGWNGIVGRACDHGFDIRRIEKNYIKFTSHGCTWHGWPCRIYESPLENNISHWVHLCATHAQHFHTFPLTFFKVMHFRIEVVTLAPKNVWPPSYKYVHIVIVLFIIPKYPLNIKLSS